MTIIHRTIGLWPDRKVLLRARVRIALSDGRYKDALRLSADPTMDLAAEERPAFSAALADAAITPKRGSGINRWPDPYGRFGLTGPNSRPSAFGHNKSLTANG